MSGIECCIQKIALSVDVVVVVIVVHVVTNPEPILPDGDPNALKAPDKLVGKRFAID